MHPTSRPPRSLIAAVLVTAWASSACSGDAPADNGAGGSGGHGGAQEDAAGGSAGGSPRDAGGASAPDVPIADVAAEVGATSTDSAAVDASADAGVAADSGMPDPAGAIVWSIDNLQKIGGHATSVLGAPMVIDTPGGKALQFDGTDDALFVENHPLAGMGQFTVEIIFRPDAGGSPAQRWFHMQEGGAGGRVLFETRLPGNNSWVLDVFIESKAGEVASYDPKFAHPLGQWYHVAAVVDGKRVRHYVNGMMETDFALGFQPHGSGRTSIGVRITRMYFFKGAIRLARFTPRVLAPTEFLKAN